MSGSGAKSMRLKFKGEKSVKKKKKSTSDGGGSISGRTGHAELDADEAEKALYAGNETAWVPVEHPTDLHGPVLIYQPYVPVDAEGAAHHDRAKQAGGSAPQAQHATRLLPHYSLAIDPNLSRVAPSLIEPEPIEPASAIEGGSASTDDHQRRDVSSREQQKLLLELELDGAQVVDDVVGSVAPPPRHPVPPAFSVEPRAVQQVWVATRVPDTPASAPRYTLKSCEQRFLTAERTGKLSASAEARGPQEEWTVVAAPPGGGASEEDGPEEGGHEEEGRRTGRGGRKRVRLGTSMFFKSSHGTLLSLDETAGGKMAVRADFAISAAGGGGDGGADGSGASEPPGETERWNVMVQWKFRREARKREEAAQKAHLRKGWTAAAGGGGASTVRGGIMVTSRDSMLNDPNARRIGVTTVGVGGKRKGLSAEELLDRRVKMKSDRTCK